MRLTGSGGRSILRSAPLAPSTRPPPAGGGGEGGLQGRTPLIATLEAARWIIWMPQRNGRPFAVTRGGPHHGRGMFGQWARWEAHSPATAMLGCRGDAGTSAARSRHSRSASKRAEHQACRVDLQRLCRRDGSLQRVQRCDRLPALKRHCARRHGVHTANALSTCWHAQVSHSFNFCIHHRAGAAQALGCTGGDAHRPLLPAP